MTVIGGSSFIPNSSEISATSANFLNSAQDKHKFWLPEPPSDNHIPTFEEYQEREEMKQHAINSTLREYYARLNPELTSEQRFLAIDKADRYLRARIENAENAYFGKNKSL